MFIKARLQVTFFPIEILKKMTRKYCKGWFRCKWYMHSQFLNFPPHIKCTIMLRCVVFSMTRSCGSGTRVNMLTGWMKIHCSIGVGDGIGVIFRHPLEFQMLKFITMKPELNMSIVINDMFWLDMLGLVNRKSINRYWKWKHKSR